MRKFLIALGLAAAMCSPALAEIRVVGNLKCATVEQATALPPCWQLAQFQPPEHVQKAIDEAIKKQVEQRLPEGGIHIPPLGAIGDPDQGRIGTPNIIVHQAPAPPKAVIDTGGIAGEIIQWVIATFGTVIAGYVVLLVKRLAAKAGVQLSQQASDRLDQIVLNGLHAGANEAQRDLRGKGQVEVKNDTLASMVTYAQAHGADTLKVLGVDPNDPATVAALRARAERLIADPAVPTPAVLDAKAPAAPAAATQAGPADAPRG
jgi:hypothetical protein